MDQQDKRTKELADRIQNFRSDTREVLDSRLARIGETMLQDYQQARKTRKDQKQVEEQERLAYSSMMASTRQNNQN